MNVDKMKELAGTEVKSTGPAKEFEIPPCYRIFDKAWFCVTPMNQIAKYYVHGELDNCLIPMNDWTLCMTAKLYTKEAMKQVRVSMIIRDMLDKCTLLPQDFQKAQVLLSSSPNFSPFSFINPDFQKIMSRAGIYQTSTHKNKVWELKKRPGWLTSFEKEPEDEDVFDPSNFPGFDEYDEGLHLPTK